jgi:putative hydrolase of the HAD superfamily
MDGMGNIKWVVLDGMGVIYRNADIVRSLLIPFVRERGCESPDDFIARDYRQASLGRMSSEELWASCGLGEYEGLDCDYTFLHALNPGLRDALAKLHENGIRTACLTNDLSEWSRLLRRRFGLEKWIGPWIVSAEVRCRKPDRPIYEKLLAESGARACECLFVDDREQNLATAARLGMQTLLFRDAPAAALFEKLVLTATGKA